MDPGFEMVWRRVAGVTEVEDEQTKLRCWIGDETEAEQIYASLLKRSSVGSIRKALSVLLQAKRQQLRKLRVQYFLRTGDRAIFRRQAQLPDEPMLETLRSRYAAESAMAESYRSMTGAREDTAALCNGLAEAADRQAAILRSLIGRLL